MEFSEVLREITEKLKSNQVANLINCYIHGRSIINITPQVDLEHEIKLLFEDNQKLSYLLKEKMQHNAPHGAEDQADQILLLTKERDSLHVLWQTAQKTIDALEAELQTYQNYERRGQQNVIEEKRDLELKLDSSLSDYLTLEQKYKDLHNKFTTLQTDNHNKDKEITASKEKIKDLEIKLEEVKKAFEETRIELAVERKSNDDIKAQLMLCQKESVSLIRREAEAKSKVAEAMQLYDLVEVQKNEALKEITRMAEEMSSLKKELSEVKQVTENCYRIEMDDTREKYNAKMNDMLNHVRNLDSELVEKGLLLNKFMRENKILQAANDKYLTEQKKEIESIEPKLKLAEQKIEAMFQELVSAERRSIKLDCEKQNLLMDLKRSQDIYTRDTKRRDWEERLLQNECKDLKLHVEHLQKSLQASHEMISKLQNILASRSSLEERLGSSNKDEFIELSKQLENQMELNKKWKESYIDMTNKMKKRLKELYKENKKLRTELNRPDSNSVHSSTGDNNSQSITN